MSVAYGMQYRYRTWKHKVLETEKRDVQGIDENENWHKKNNLSSSCTTYVRHIGIRYLVFITRFAMKPKSKTMQLLFEEKVCV